MDSLSQFTLGAALGMVTLGRRIGYRKAALTGGLLGSLPDADVFYPFDDPVDSFTLHRSATHSLILQTLATPVIGEGLRLAFKGLKDRRALSYLTVFLILTTHALLDAMTVYGTRLFWPLWPDPLGLGSIFIIDPLYTLPLLVALVWGLIAGGSGARPGRVAAVGLALSTLYLGWTAAAQQAVAARGESYLKAAGMEPERLLAIPTPFNSLYWRVIAVEGGRYHNLYFPVFGGIAAEGLYSHDRLPDELACVTALPEAARLAAFSDGYFKVGRKAGRIVVSDLRMGLTPAYVFRFAVAEEGAEGQIAEIPPQRMPVTRNAGDGDLDWLLAGIAGETQVRASESSLALRPMELAASESEGTAESC